MKQTWCKSVKIISGLTGLILALSNSAFAATAPKSPEKKETKTQEKKPGTVTIEHNGNKTIIKFDNKAGSTETKKVMPAPVTKITQPVPAKTPVPVKVETKAAPVQPAKTETKITTPVKADNKAVAPSDSTVILPKTDDKTVPSAPPKIEKPVIINIPKEPVKEIETKKEASIPVVIKPALSSKDKLELSNFTFFSNLESSVALINTVLNSVCAYDVSACNEKELVNILADNILEDLKLRYPASSKNIYKEQVILLLNNARILKEKITDINTTQLNYLLSNLNEVNSFFHKDKEVKLIQKLNEMQASKPADTEIITDVKPGIVPPDTNTKPEKVIMKGKMVFVSERDGNPEIYVMNADGSNQTRLTNNESFDIMPAWSPDGSKIAFVSERDGNPEIYVMDADGSNQVRLTDNSSYDYSPSWSPDGSQLTFVSNRENTQTGNGTLIKINYRIFVMNADGTEQVMISDTSVSDESPKWSPDGKKIAFVSRRDGNAEIYTMNTDGTEQRRLTNSFSNDLMPNWSPDSKKIAFRSDRDGNPEIYVMNADGSKQFRVTENSTVDESPCWSSDGKKIIFVSKRDFVMSEDGYNTSELYIMNENGTNIERLTKNESEDSFPDFK